MTLAANAIVPMFTNSKYVPERRLVLLAVGLLGVSCVTTQLAPLRELLTAFSGNEMVLGIILGNWFLLTGLVSWLGRKADRLLLPSQFRPLFRC